MYDVCVRPGQLEVTHFRTRTTDTCEKTLYVLFGNLTQFKKTIFAAKSCADVDPKKANNYMWSILTCDDQYVIEYDTEVVMYSIRGWRF